MTRLIDADSIPWFVEGVGDIPVITKEEIDDMPTVDAVPVRHGKWIIEDGHVCCSECGEISKEYNWCPYCGARMDEEKAE